MNSITIDSLKTVSAKQFDSTFKCKNSENYDWYCDYFCEQQIYLTNVSRLPSRCESSLKLKVTLRNENIYG